MNNSAYNRRDVESILAYLKEKAIELSNGRWTDFSSGDIGSVLLGLMAQLADMNNFQIDKTASELYLDTAVERTSIMSLLKLIGYEPRHYMSAYTTISLENQDFENEAATIIPAYSFFTNETGTIRYTALEDIYINKGRGYGIVYEGTRVVNTYNYNQITAEGRIYLPDYKLGMNTIQVQIPSVADGFIDYVEDVRFIAGEFAFSAHVDEFAQVYIQLPAYWSDLMSATSTVTVSYLLTEGEAGRIGSNILTQAGTGLTLTNNYFITNPMPSEGGYFPETTDEIKVSAPRHARTMETIVTKRDMEDLVIDLPEVAYIKCGDYNDKWTGLKYPTSGPDGVINDAYQAIVLAVPTNTAETSLYEHENPSDEYSALVPTATLRKMMNYIDERRLASLYIQYKDPKRTTPKIKLKIYTNESDLRATTIAERSELFMKQVYDRQRLVIGQSLYGSVVGKDLLNYFSEITYVEVQAPEYNIPVADDEYIDMFYSKFKIYVNDILTINEWEDGDEIGTEDHS